MTSSYRHSIAICLCTLTLGASMAARAEEMPVPEHEPAPVTVSRMNDFSSRASELTQRAMGLIGIRYKYGGNDPETGLDCSGLVRYLFNTVWGLTLPRTSLEISKVGQKVAQQDLQIGDLVFFNTLRRGFSHVGIYLGNRKFIHAPSAGGQIRVESMDVAYWKKRFNGARRIAVHPQAVQQPLN